MTSKKDRWKETRAIDVPYRINCERAECTKKATRVLHWVGHNRKPWLMCDECSEQATKVMHL